MRRDLGEKPTGVPTVKTEEEEDKGANPRAGTMMKEKTEEDVMPQSI